MTPKEKAKQLIESMAFSCRECDYESKAKQCALVAVNEIIEATNMYQYGINNSLEHIAAKIVKHPYWQEVKQEIENL